MQTIIVLLNPGMLENADLDLRYRIPDRIEEVSNSLIQSNGYDYIDTEDVSCVESVENNTREITLITCTNGHKNRLVTKAREVL